MFWVSQFSAQPAQPKGEWLKADMAMPRPNRIGDEPARDSSEPSKEKPE
jgi:hypothetical protein